MTSLEYVTIPPSATRLEPYPSNLPQKKVFTPLPSLPRKISTPAPTSPSIVTSPTNAAFTMLPQLLFASSISSSNGPKHKHTPLLLTNKDPLSLPTTSTNFKRFVTKAGPIFWLQDRIEEVVMWRRGWRVTTLWIAVYAFLCYFPPAIFAIPHVVLIGVMLYSYPYPELKVSASASTPPTTSESSNWQANLQAIQNLMGLVADTHDLVQPYTHLLALSPTHFHPTTPTTTTTSTSPHPHSPYPPYILLSLLLTFPPLLLFLASPFFPMRLACLLAGLTPLFASHPTIRPVLVPVSQILAEGAMDACQVGLNVLVRRCWVLRSLSVRVWRRCTSLRPNAKAKGGNEDDRWVLPPLKTILERWRDDDRLDDVCWRSEMREVELWENERYLAPVHGPQGSTEGDGGLPAYPDGHDADMNESETPFNNENTERRSSTASATTPTTSPTTSPTSSPTLPKTRPRPIPHPTDPGWSKSNLHPGERRAWTRGRDGWGGIGTGVGVGVGVGGGAAGGASENEGGGVAAGDETRVGEGVGAEGVVSSNLTFSLASGWAFVDTEGWRRDLTRSWAFDGGSSVGFDPCDVNNINMDGWVYTNDVWDDVRGEPFERSVTRRRRWVRRVWFGGEDKK